MGYDMIIDGIRSSLRGVLSDGELALLDSNPRSLASIISERSAQRRRRNEGLKAQIALLDAAYETIGNAQEEMMLLAKRLFKDIEPYVLDWKGDNAEFFVKEYASLVPEQKNILSISALGSLLGEYDDARDEINRERSRIRKEIHGNSTIYGALDKAYTEVCNLFN